MSRIGSIPDAYVYDCVNKKIVTVGEAKANPGILKEIFKLDIAVKDKTVTRTRVYYDPRIFTEYKIHDVSLFHLSDFIDAFVLTFDRVCPTSKLYDDRQY